MSNDQTFKSLTRPRPAILPPGRCSVAGGPLLETETMQVDIKSKYIDETVVLHYENAPTTPKSRKVCYENESRNIGND